MKSNRPPDRLASPATGDGQVDRLEADSEEQFLVGGDNGIAATAFPRKSRVEDAQSQWSEASQRFTDERILVLMQNASAAHDVVRALGENGLLAQSCADVPALVGASRRG